MSGAGRKREGKRREGEREITESPFLPLQVGPDAGAAARAVGSTPGASGRAAFSMAAVPGGGTSVGRYRPLGPDESPRHHAGRRQRYLSVVGGAKIDKRCGDPVAGRIPV